MLSTLQVIQNFYQLKFCFKMTQRVIRTHPEMCSESRRVELRLESKKLIKVCDVQEGKRVFFGSNERSDENAEFEGNF